MRGRLFSALALLLAIACLLTLSGCPMPESVDPVTATEFQTAVADLGYTVIDLSEQYAAQNAAVQSCAAIEAENLYVEFFVFDAVDNASSHFDTTKRDIEKKRGFVFNRETWIHADSRWLYKVKSSGKYRIVTQVNTTVLYGRTDSSNAKALDEIVKAIGYCD